MNTYFNRLRADPTYYHLRFVIVGPRANDFIASLKTAAYLYVMMLI